MIGYFRKQRILEIKRRLDSVKHKGPEVERICLDFGISRRTAYNDYKKADEIEKSSQN